MTLQYLLGNLVVLRLSGRFYIRICNSFWLRQGGIRRRFIVYPETSKVITAEDMIIPAKSPGPGGPGVVIASISVSVGREFLRFCGHRYEH
jgi:hypothetical protein